MGDLAKLWTDARNVKNPPFTLIIAVSLHLEYYLSSRVRLFLSISFFCMDKVEVLREKRRVIPFSMSVLDSKTNALSYL